MAKLFKNPTTIEAAGNKPKIIEEFIGRVNSSNSNISIAKMTSPAGWQEPGQTPDFTEFTYVISGNLRVETKDGIINVNSGQSIQTDPNEWVRYSTPDGAEYIAVCLPAFSPDIVHRDE